MTATGNKALVFESAPIRHQDGGFVVRLLQFKPNYLSQSEATKTDFIRTAKSLICSPELDGDILTFPKLPYFGTRNQHQILKEGKIVLITATAQLPLNMDPKNQPMDYTVQWAEYYRSVGMIREAEELELKFLMVRDYMNLCALNV